jgi:adenosylcobinamide amidohydrolase
MTVEVTQYLRPDGRKELMHTEIRDSFAAPYHAITGRGWRIAAEVLTTGAVSITVEDDEQDFACRISENGPGVQRAIEECIAEAISLQPVEC